MKVSKIIFKEHPVFPNDSTVTFFDPTIEDVPKIFFVVGNNGAGKTHLLESIFFGLTSQTAYKKVDKFKIEVDVKLLDSEGPTGTNNLMTLISSKKNHSTSSSHGKQEIVKAVYSSLDVTFDVPDISSVTASVTDGDEIPKKMSKDLSKVIPQLLIDLDTQDAKMRSKWMQENPGKPGNQFTGEIKFDRFKDAFKKMYESSKTFEAIRPEGGKHKILFKDINGNEVSISDFSTGEKQILFRVGELLINLGKMDGAMVFIDEPETSLHPIWQTRYTQFLLDIFDGLDVQFFIATHSPYILQGLEDGKSVCVKVDRFCSGDEKGEVLGYYPNSINSPSHNLINYIAYDIFDELLHIELFTALLIKHNEDGPSGLGNNLFSSLSYIPDITFTVTKAFGGKNIGDTVTEKLPVFIRNNIHHPDELGRSYTKQMLKDSIDIMLSLI